MTSEADVKPAAADEEMGKRSAGGGSVKQRRIAASENSSTDGESLTFSGNSQVPCLNNVIN